MTAFLARQERFEQIGSTNDAVRAWLDAGTPEVCLAVADEQTAGRGRAGRTWTAPPGAALLLSLGFRPAWLTPGHAWRLAAVTSLAMADTAEDVAGLRIGAVRLKWPNDLVIETDAPEADAPETDTPEADAPEAGEAWPIDVAAEPVAGLGGGLLRKLGGVLGEADGLGTDDPRVVVGIGLNAGWARADFPAEIAPAMTSLAEAGGGRPIARALLLDGFLSRLEARVEALRAGRFPMDDWTTRQVTTGRIVRLEGHGSAPEDVRALGLDPATGALVVADSTVPGGERAVHAGDVVHVRLAGAAGADRAAAPRAASRASAAGV